MSARRFDELVRVGTYAGTMVAGAAPAAAVPAAAAAQAALAGARAGKRRRLWQLTAQAHELLLAMSFTPEELRREAVRSLGQVHRGQCVLKGHDVDVLYGVVHDMLTRNPLSEAMHKRLDERHALAVRQLTALRDAEALRAAWANALRADTLSSALWALLTHSLGETVETAVLYDARHWVFAHARRSVRLKQAQAQTETRAQEARQRADQLQSRLSAHQQQSNEALGQARAEIARLQGELKRRQDLTVESASPAAVHRTEPRAEAPKVKPRSEPPADVALPAVAAAPAAEGVDSPAPGLPPIGVDGRRVLCVGGIQHAVARYRGRIEKLGGRFEHHDGGVEDSVHALDARLNRADVVLCQTACINHEAYHRVKRHCERTGTPCVYLDRPSLARLDRALAQAPVA